MTVIARKVAAVPAQMPGAAWDAICHLLAKSGTDELDELQSVKNVGSMLIAETYTRSAPIILSNAGPQVRIYTIHGDRAVDTEDPKPLSIELADHNWSLSLPAAGDDVALARKIIESCSRRITVRDFGEDDEASTSASATCRSYDFTIDMGRL